MLFFAPILTEGTTVAWKVQDGNWENPSCWTDDRVPSAGATVLIENGGRSFLTGSSNEVSFGDLQVNHSSELNFTGAGVIRFSDGYFGANDKAEALHSSVRAATVKQTGSTVKFAGSLRLGKGSWSKVVYDINNGNLEVGKDIILAEVDNGKNSQVEINLKNSDLTIGLRGGSFKIGPEKGGYKNIYVNQRGGSVRVLNKGDFLLGGRNSTSRYTLEGGSIYVDGNLKLRSISAGINILEIIGKGTDSKSSGIAVKGSFMQERPTDSWRAQNVLRFVIDASGLAAIEIAGKASFGQGSLLQMDFAKGYSPVASTNAPFYGHHDPRNINFQYTVIRAAEIIGMPVIENDYNWQVSVTNSSLVLTYWPYGVPCDAPESAFFAGFDGDSEGSFDGSDSKSPVKAHFVNGSTRAGLLPEKGLAGSFCLDTTRPINTKRGPAVPVYENEKFLDSIADSKSFTITGWINRPGNYEDEDVTDQFVLNFPGLFSISSNGRYPNIIYLRLGEGPAGDREKTNQVDPPKNSAISSSWIHSFAPEDRWVFFAITYDGTQEKDNVNVYYGYEEYPVIRDKHASVPPKAANSSKIRKLVIGASDVNGEKAFKGLIDNIRIYCDTPSSSGALSALQLEKVRKTDLALRNVPHADALQQPSQVNDRNAAIEWRGNLAAHQVGVAQDVFTDRAPSVTAQRPISLPRGGKGFFKMAIKSDVEGVCKMQIRPLNGPGGKIIDVGSLLYELKPVYVEKNVNGPYGSDLRLMSAGYFQEFQTRKAPFSVPEVMVPAKDIQLRPGAFQYVALEVKIPTGAVAGSYSGAVSFTRGGNSVEVPFVVNVHDIIVRPDMDFHSLTWLWPEPENLTTADTPEWWSPEHWRLLRNTAKVFNDFWQDVIFTPLMNYKEPLIQTHIDADGKYWFDYARFDVWVEMFMASGARQIAGMHLSRLPFEGGVYAVNSKGEKTLLFDPKSEPWSHYYNNEKWHEFLPGFLTSFRKHLEEKGWLDIYVQHVYDEPTSEEKYLRKANLVREYMPGIKTIDALKSKPGYSDYSDIMVFDYELFRADMQKLAHKRTSEGKQNWIYHCISPYPPYPNRHLDRPLVDSRLYPWLLYVTGADGYLFWAANFYYGLNPYITSEPSTGDSWLFYPTDDGLTGSVRMMAFYDGMLDHKLMKMLASHDPAAARAIAADIIRNPSDYEKSELAYDKIRERILQALDGFSRSNSPVK